MEKAAATMDAEYDKKFEEMKKYIPFLESMIKRLENTSSVSNPRQAQLDKIRSLRDLLLDKKKRMKMENLLKCEQVLVNLYAKVEQRETLPGIKKASDSLFPSDSTSPKKDLETVRNKLKVVSKIHDAETLPEIDRATETEVICTPGSKEPALFQRRPNKSSISPSSDTKPPQKATSKRNYTRVLVSPERGSRRWNTTEDSTSDVKQALFSRRSPRKSPRRHSPSYHKKERKKSSKPAKSRDLNITLNVPEESLNSLNTDDILSRIITCSDNDVDIDTLRDLRTQILGELKQTGASDDISDLILKSYKNTKSNDKKPKKDKEKEEIEEGELSDSESEAIESIYGSLVVLDTDKTAKNELKTISEKEKQPRKIQICLVLNSEKDTVADTPKETAIADVPDFETFDLNAQSTQSKNTPKGKVRVVFSGPNSSVPKNLEDNRSNFDIDAINEDEVKRSSKIGNVNNYEIDSSFFDLSSITEKDAHPVEEVAKKDPPFKPNFYKPLNDQENMTEKVEKESRVAKNEQKTKVSVHLEVNKIQTSENRPNVEIGDKKSESTLLKTDDSLTTSKTDISQYTESKTDNQNNNSKELENISAKSNEQSSNIEIPLLNEPTVQAVKQNVVSEIDILQALKNEILSDSISIPGSDSSTPLLHQPKITKVASAQEIMNKKRISIEKYKEKSVSTSKPSLFTQERNTFISNEESAKKQSLKLTEKECERFNFPAKLALDESSDDDDEILNKSLNDIYGDLAPKSPEDEDILCNNATNSPVIIPVDPVKTALVNTKADIDMRTSLIPNVSPNTTMPIPRNVSKASPSINSEEENKSELNKRPSFVDPRVRRELSKSASVDSPNSDRTSRAFNLNNMTPNATPNMTPSRTPNMTPNSRAYDITHQSFDQDENPNRKFVYAPMFSVQESRETREISVNKDGPRQHQWDANSDIVSEVRSRWEHSEVRDSNNSRVWDDRNAKSSVQRDSGYQKTNYDASKNQQERRNDRYHIDRRDSYNRLDCPKTPVPSFGRSDCPTTPTPSFGRLDTPMTPIHPFGISECPPTPGQLLARSDCPLTPNHPFGRLECPPTPSHSFGRSDCPVTPSHPFGRTDCPMTPSHPFGRNECPMTPSHPFGRSECPMTPSHPFGRSECPMTPSHTFGRSEMGIAPMTPSHPFGRSDYSQNSGPKYVKDPRLNRSTDYDKGLYNDDRDRSGFYKDRRKSDIQNRNDNCSDSYRNFREQSVGRNGRNSSYDNNVRSYTSEQASHREPSVGRTSSRDYESEQLYSRNRDKNTNYRSGTRDHSYYDEHRQSHGRTMPSDKFGHSSSRASSVGRNYDDKANNDKKLSVKPQSGRSFTIDTSVNSTFQEFLDGKGLQLFDNSFDARRQRASSVGRSMPFKSFENVGRTFRESSVGRILPKPYQPTYGNIDLKQRNKFTRAQSMGRELGDKSKQERSLKDIKADFESYSANYKTKEVRPYKKSSEDPNRRDPFLRKFNYESQHDHKTSPVNKQVYSPRKNYRDPRMRREQQNDKHREDKRNNYGIYYSNDNIAKGTILGTGYGVKNYKIPKIKRDEKVEKVEAKVEKIEEKKETSDKNKRIRKIDQDTATKAKKIENRGKECKIDNSKEKAKKQSGISKRNVDDQKSKVDTKTAVVDSTTKRNSKSNVKSDTIEVKSVDKETIKRTKRNKKPVIHDSDSDTGDVSKEQKGTGDTKTAQIESVCNEDLENEFGKDQDDEIDSSFGIDDIEIFTDNITADPSMASITALIENLDNDISTSKTTDSNKTDSSEIVLENMLEAIDSPEADIKQNTVEESLNDISELITADLIKLNPESLEKNLELKESSDKGSKKDDEKSISTELELSLDHKSSQELDNVKDVINANSLKPYESQVTINNENIVSTTEADKGLPEFVKDKIEQKVEESSDDKKNDHSTPDSTINTNSMSDSKNEKSFPDSTNEMQNEMHSDITSTHESTENKDATETSKKESIQPQIESFGNLLSILQDKSKLKELLGMLDDNSSENEKIKKKLEKLSAIVSDDEDTGEADQGNPEITNEKDTLQKDPEKQPLEKIQTARDELKQPDPEPVVIQDKSQCNVDENHENNVVDENDISPETSNLEGEPSHISTIGEITEESSKLVKPHKPNKRTRKRGKSNIVLKEKRMTRSTAVNLQKEKPKTANRELQKLHEDIKEMFLSDDILNDTGIRMCRLAKLVDEKNVQEEVIKETKPAKPVVLLEKFIDKEDNEDTQFTDKVAKKKIGPKPKAKQSVKSVSSSELKNKEKNKVIIKNKPGPKSKTKLNNQDMSDPYEFETDSYCESNTTKTTEDFVQNSSDSEDESLASTKSFGSSEVLAEMKKKPKRKRRGWQAGVIKPKKRKKTGTKQKDSELEDNTLVPKRKFTIPDLTCFTDKTHCFLKNVSSYSCRLCEYSGKEIVHHYKKHHPHSEIPLSRMNPTIAREAIEQCEGINFQAVSRISTDKYICRFCFKEIGGKKGALEEFFWHVVSMHTGEYKQLCSECINVTRCPFNLDIPPPPKDIKGQLIGYICEKCNFTQVSLENLKTHVIVRHNDEQTEVYTVNLAVMSKKTVNTLLNRSQTLDEPRILRSSRSNQSAIEASDERSDVTESTDQSDADSGKIDTAKKQSLAIQKVKSHSKISFESDNSDISNLTHINSKVKFEEEDEDQNQVDTSHFDDASDTRDVSLSDRLSDTETERPALSDDIFAYPHFKIRHTDAGTKEYVCCINGDMHYTTMLLISMKKHVQVKHTENWDGYCFVCKVIVTPQGEHRFKECFQHFLDIHMDNFPVLEPSTTTTENPEVTPTETSNTSSVCSVVELPTSKSYINVLSISDLMSKDVLSAAPAESSVSLPKIASVMSLGITTDVIPSSSTNCPPAVALPDEAESLLTIPPKETSIQEETQERPYKYEEAQAQVMSQKIQVVLDTMITHEKLVQIFKCAGRYCSFTSNSPEDSLLHTSTHKRIGGENSLICAYCDFDCLENAVDLVMHVFKNHGRCPFTCTKCFYRASASQLVRAHMTRVHGEEVAKEAVLKTETVTQIQDDSSEILPREKAVKHYFCVENKQCRFKTYTSGKFGEHLTRHDPPYCCYLCGVTTNNPPDMVQHMKTHGLKLYQCTWCVYGADNETELLAHASKNHPSLQPQAYLRIITNKEGTSKMMVLPLAQLNKSTCAVKIVKSSSNKENAVREAERSLDLEKLLGSITTVIRTTDQNNGNKGSTATSALENPLIKDDLESGILLDEPPRFMTPPPTTSTSESNLSLQMTPILKTEPVDETPDKDIQSQPEIICLDSDEENSEALRLPSDHVALSTSKDLATPVSTFETIPSSRLYKCSKCEVTMKHVMSFRKHVKKVCYADSPRGIKCAHCPLILNDADKLFKHYHEDHNENTQLSNMQNSRNASNDKNRYVCGICNFRHSTLSFLRKHLKANHDVSNLIVSSKYLENGEFSYVVKEDNQKPGPKRKLSNANEASPAKKKRYSPQDVSSLPPKPILDELVYCSLCEFNTKVRLNMVRHLQLHAESQPVPQTAPVNPVPHLETNEKFFDKMVNLASSSVINRAPDKVTRVESAPSVSFLIPPEAASRYPKFVIDRQRYTCGAKGCSYISLDEAMLKCHWETLHAGSNDFHCVHCPRHQLLDTSRPLTAVRIIAHIKMHDINLYACSSCMYYHHKKQFVEKHLEDVHQSSGHVMVVREENQAPSLTGNPPASVAPTMDLKAWQCGVCKFKSMLRPEVVEHCAKIHNTKMQFKCPNCPFRASSFENVSKHQSNSHPGSKDDIFYYYYREGSIPDEADGTPRWLKQRQKMGNPDSEVKTEVPDSSISNLPQVANNLTAVNAPLLVDLNIVKTEVVEPEKEESIEELYKKFGQFCDPNGLKYKCPLCKIIMEDTKENMQSHLYEELKYRKWGCSICSYKAFHKTGLSEHMLTEHRRQNQEPFELPVNTNIEKWVSMLLEYQTKLIEKNKENLAKQRIIADKPSTILTTTASKTQETPIETSTIDTLELEEAFGPLGESKNMEFCCPKCSYKVKDEVEMQNHLESELNKIRWRCTNCLENFQKYHEAQLHCKSVHPGRNARPAEAKRSPVLRTAWVSAVIRTQKIGMSNDALVPSTSNIQPNSSKMLESVENSLLVVRYEKRVPTPEEEMLVKRKKPSERTVPVASTFSPEEEMLSKRKNQTEKPTPTSSTSTPDSDDERLVIDELTEEDPSETEHPQQQKSLKKCEHCNYVSKYSKAVYDHTLRHYNLKPLQCNYCNLTCWKPSAPLHHFRFHRDLPKSFSKTKLPKGPPLKTVLKKGIKISEDDKNKEDVPKLICLVCEKAIPVSDTETHVHDANKVQFARKGDVVVKCCICLALVVNVNSMQEHHDACHPNMPINYAFFKLYYDTREIHICFHCNMKFKFIRDLRTHHNTMHSSLPLKYVSKTYTHEQTDSIDCDDDRSDDSKRTSVDLTDLPPVKRVAKKSTTKLPTQSVAKKSTTKLPFFTYSESDDDLKSVCSDSDEEYSSYGTKPTSLEDYSNVTTDMPFCNTMMTFTMKKLSEIIKINPIVIVKDIYK